jgi:hypothetical protein
MKCKGRKIKVVWMNAFNTRIKMVLKMAMEYIPSEKRYKNW